MKKISNLFLKIIIKTNNNNNQKKIKINNKPISGIPKNQRTPSPFSYILHPQK